MYKILIADDDPRIREILRVYFKKADFEVIEAEDGQQALTKVEKEKPNIVLLDIMMPVMDGIQACEEIRSTYDIPIIMLTAKDEDDDRILGLEQGADDYITKPFNAREVIARVKAVLRRSGGFQNWQSGNPALSCRPQRSSALCVHDTRPLLQSSTDRQGCSHARYAGRVP